MRRPIIALLAVALTLPVLAGCSDDEETAQAENVEPVTLRIGTDDEPGKPASDQIEEFGRRVARLSDGQIRIKPVWHAAGEGPDWDQRVARMVTSGELELGLIPSRSWDTEGVSSLRALNAPFLIDSDELLAEVISGELADDLMSGLDEAGVTGIAMFPEGLRHPFGLEKPVFGPEDYRGEAVRTATSDTVAAMFGELGASVTDEDPDPRHHVAMESSYLLIPGGTATANVTFYPKVNSLVGNARAYERLDDAQRDVLAKAAAETREWAIRSLPNDAEAAQAFCDEGGLVVLADEADVDALEDATATLYDELGRDEQTKELIEAIREMKQSTGVSATAAEPCGGTAGQGGSAALDGEYRFEITDAQLRDVGITDPGDVDENHGVFDVSLSGGEYCWQQTAPNPLGNPDECSTYELEGKRMIWRFPSGQPDVYRWSKKPNGDLELSFVSSADPPFAKVWSVNTWERTGDAK